MKKILFFISIQLILISSLHSKDFQSIEQTEAVLTVEGDIRASMSVSMKKEDQETWRLKSEIHKFGFTFRKETAKFKLLKNKIIPMNWSRKGEADVEFNWKEKTLKFKEKKQEGTLPLTDDVLGPATAQIKLRLDLRKYDISSLPDKLEYRVYYKGKIKKRVFNINGLEDISTPLGDYMTIKVSRERLEDQDREQIFWLAPDLDFAIIQILNDDGKRRVKIKMKKENSYL